MSIIKLSVKTIKLFVISMFLIAPALFVYANQVHAQVGQLWETIVGNPNEQPPPDDDWVDPGGGGTGGDGTGDDGLGPGEFEIPVRCGLTYGTGTYPGHTPYALDLNRAGEIDKGDPVLASADGVVTDDTYKFSDGQIVIRHEGGWYTIYAHMQNVIVKEGQRVRVGQKIGEINDKGNSYGSHLHVGHSLGDPYYGHPSYAVTNYKQICYKRYGCNKASVYSTTYDRAGYALNKGCP